MNEDIIAMAREAGYGDHMSVLHAPALERFAALFAKHTLANIDPSSFMSWQEGHEAGRLAEREACARVCESEGERIDASWMSCAAAIRARGNI